MIFLSSGCIADSHFSQSDYAKLPDARVGTHYKSALKSFGLPSSRVLNIADRHADCPLGARLWLYNSSVQTASKPLPDDFPLAVYIDPKEKICALVSDSDNHSLFKFRSDVSEWAIKKRRLAKDIFAGASLRVSMTFDNDPELVNEEHLTLDRHFKSLVKKKRIEDFVAVFARGARISRSFFETESVDVEDPFCQALKGEADRLQSWEDLQTDHYYPIPSSPSENDAALTIFTVIVFAPVAFIDALIYPFHAVYQAFSTSPSVCTSILMEE